MRLMTPNTRTPPIPWPRALLWLGALVWLGAATLSGCGHKTDTRDPVTITRTFLLAWWHADEDTVRALTCENTTWPQIGDPKAQIDLDHARLEVTFSSEKYAEVELGGVVTFKTADGQVEVRDYDQVGTVVFVLRQRDGWKVCDTLSRP